MKDDDIRDPWGGAHRAGTMDRLPRLDLEDYKARVKRAEPILYAYRKMLVEGRRALAHMADLGAANPMLSHTVTRLCEARELVESTLADMAPEIVERSLKDNWCVHCGRPKKPEQAFCHRNCELCHAKPVPEGRPCAMICVSQLAGQNPPPL